MLSPILGIAAAFTFLQQTPQPPPVTTGIVGTIDQFTNMLLAYLVAFASVGALAMALIEAGKKFYDFRTKFHAKRFTAWVAKSLADIKPRPGIPSAEDAIAEFMQLCSAMPRDHAREAAKRLHDKRGRLAFLHAFRPEPAHAAFTLDIDRMMGALQDATDTALNSPQRYPALYYFATSGGDATDVDDWFREAPKGLTDVNVAAELKGPELEKANERVKQFTDRAARLRQVVKRKLDAFQLLAAERWASFNQTWAIVVGGAIMFAVLSWMQATNTPGAPSASAIIPLTLVGGILSPVAKDIASTLKRRGDG